VRYKLDGVCEEHVKWGMANPHPLGDQWDHHAFNHTSGPKGEYCFWCGIHYRGLYRRDDAGEFTVEDWERDKAIEDSRRIDRTPKT